MKEKIDCLFIGHNDQGYDAIERIVSQTGLNSFFYREFESSYLWHQQKRYGLIDFINKWYCEPYLYKPLTMGNHFSAAIAYLSTFLNRRGFTFDYVNSFQDERATLADKLLKNNIVTIAITTTLYMFHEPIQEIIQFIKQYNRTAKIVVGGPYIYYEARSLPKKDFHTLCEVLGADFVVISNQGEATLVNIINAIKNRQPFTSVKNIWYRVGQSYKNTPTQEEDNSLSDNMVNWKLFDGGLSEYIHVRTSKGCPYSCAFCDFLEFAGGRHQYVDVSAVEQELSTLPHITPLHVEFIDDTCNVPPERFKEMLRMFVRNNYHFQWSCQIRCQFVDNEMAKLMHDTGCTSVFLGLESGNNQILENMNKRVKVFELQRGIDHLKKYNIPITGSFVVGFPGETDKTIQDTIDFINSSGIDFYRLEAWGYSELAPIAKAKKKYGIEAKDTYVWKHRTMDADTAVNKQEEIAMSVDKKVVNLYDKKKTEFTIIPLLLHRHMNLQQIKAVLTAFNMGIEEKLRNPALKEVSPVLVEQFKLACHKSF